MIFSRLQPWSYLRLPGWLLVSLVREEMPFPHIPQPPISGRDSVRPRGWCLRERTAVAHTEAASG